MSASTVHLAKKSSKGPDRKESRLKNLLGKIAIDTGRYGPDFRRSADIAGERFQRPIAIDFPNRHAAGVGGEQADPLHDHRQPALGMLLLPGGEIGCRLLLATTGRKEFHVIEPASQPAGRNDLVIAGGAEVMDREMLGMHSAIRGMFFRAEMGLPLIEAAEIVEAAEGHVSGMRSQPHGPADLAQQIVVGIFPRRLPAQRP